METGKPAAPKTINNYTTSLGAFFKFMQAQAADLRLPIVIANPAHASFIQRKQNDPVKETEALTLPQIRQLLAMPQGDDVIALRDRAILNFYYLSGSRIGTGCKLSVSDFHDDGDVATYRAQLKGGKRRTKGLHVIAAQAIRDYPAIDGTREWICQFGGFAGWKPYRLRVTRNFRHVRRATLYA